YRPNGLSPLRSAKNPNLPRPTHPVLSTPWLAAKEYQANLKIKNVKHLKHLKIWVFFISGW
ncbi:hypothetical protein K661_03255, partial [Piscirickettsia salmonis LF-89 = ATCC VR-1361]